MPRGSLLGYVVDEFEFTDTILSSIESEILSTLENTIIDFSDEVQETRLYLDGDAKDKIVELSKGFDLSLSGQKIFQIVSQLILSIAIGMPKIIFINNPQRLDNDSIAIISLLLSISKDIKDHGKHTGVSFIYTYSDEEFQPYQELKDESFKEVKNLLDDQRRFAGRYAMLERPSSDIPTIAVKSSVFVGRVEELDQLKKRFDYSKTNPDKKTFEVIAADPGIGKTKLVKKHIEQLRHKEEHGSKIIQLTLLNQIGHSSSNTGLSSLIDSIVKEAQRLEQFRTLTEQGIDYLKEKAKDTAVDSIKSMLGVNSIIEIGSSINDRLDLDQKMMDFSQSANKDLDNNKSSKEKQFEQLNSAIYELKKLSNKDELPLILFIDDLQWIDDTSAEYIIEHFSKLNNVHIISTLRASDATTMLKQKYENKTLNEYSLSLLTKVNVDSNKLESEDKENYTKDKKSYIKNTNHIENTENIKLSGFDNKTLKELISLTIKGDEHKHSLLAQTIINKISTTDKKYVNTLFAIEAINMLCDEKLYSSKHTIKIDDNSEIVKYLEQQLIIQNPLRFNENIQDFQSALDDTFKLLDEKYQTAFEHINADKKFEKEQKFNLMAYAVLEERLHILKVYFGEDKEGHGNAAVNTLLFSSLLGTPFNSTIVKNVLSSLSTTDEPLLKPLKEYINNSNQCNLDDSRYEIIEEVYEILSRYVAFTSAYEYKHNLLEIFLDKQLEYKLDDILEENKRDTIKHKLYILIQKELERLKKSNLIDIKLLDSALYSISKKGIGVKLKYWNVPYAMSLSNIAYEVYNNQNFTIPDSLQKELDLNNFKKLSKNHSDKTINTVLAYLFSEKAYEYTKNSLNEVGLLDYWYPICINYCEFLLEFNLYKEAHKTIKECIEKLKLDERVIYNSDLLKVFSIQEIQNTRKYYTQSITILAKTTILYKNNLDPIDIDYTIDELEALLKKKNEKYYNTKLINNTYNIFIEYIPKNSNKSLKETITKAKSFQISSKRNKSRKKYDKAFENIESAIMLIQNIDIEKLNENYQNIISSIIVDFLELLKHKNYELFLKERKLIAYFYKIILTLNNNNILEDKEIYESIVALKKETTDFNSNIE